jgi:hypothetical protein
LEYTPCALTFGVHGLNLGSAFRLTQKIKTKGSLHSKQILNNLNIRSQKILATPESITHLHITLLGDVSSFPRRNAMP